MSSSLSPPLTPSLHHSHRCHSPSYPSLSIFLAPTLSRRILSYKSVLCYSSNALYDREETRWLREEQRWLRQEQRWVREESKWSSERSLLLHEIEGLKLQIQALEHGNMAHGATTSHSDMIATVAVLLNILKEKRIIVDSSSSASPFILEEKSDREEIEKAVVVNEGLTLTDKVKFHKERKTLRKGSEGAEVRAMQEALVKLGFFSVEEDMEFSAFSSGTERAVKTWQATFGAPEDGIMTPDLLQRLNLEKITENAGMNNEVYENQKTVAIESDVEVDLFQNRVFLLGENRWEEPSRIGGTHRKGAANDTTTKCLSCHGEGRVFCTECDGTGEPSIEPQFLEWVGEGTKCPYCEGLGYAACDVCKGKAKQ